MRLKIAAIVVIGLVVVLLIQSTTFGQTGVARIVTSVTIGITSVLGGLLTTSIGLKERRRRLEP